MKRLPTATPLLQNVPWASYRNYFWLSSNEILFLREQRQSGHFSLIRRNIEKAKETTLHELTHRFNQFHGLRWEQSLSPDRQWLLWDDVSLKQNQVTVARIDGQSSFSWSVENNYDPILWIPARSGILSTELSSTYGHNATFRSLHFPHRPISVPFQLAQKSPLNNTCCIQLLAPNRLRFIAPDYETTTQNITVFETSLDSSSRLLKFPVALPIPAIVKEISFSPDENHIAWALQTSEANNRITTTLWISDGHGQSMRLIEKRKGTISSLAWTPDSHRLSFVDGESLWLISFDKHTIRNK